MYRVAKGIGSYVLYFWLQRFLVIQKKNSMKIYNKALIKVLLLSRVLLVMQRH